MNDKRGPTSGQLEFTFSRRALFIGGVQAVIGAVVATRMAYISVAENEKYKLLSESNRVNLTLIPPRRGWFIDRIGKPIATNRADFRVDIIPDRLQSKEQTLGALTQLLDLKQEDVERIEKELKEAQGFQPVQVAAGLEYESFARVSVRLPDLPGVSPRQGFSRFYPSGAAVGHLLGYVGTVSAEEYRLDKNPLLITPGFKVGKQGLEKTMETRLRGQPGAKRTEVTARGKIVRELSSRSDTPGKPVQLTIDIDLHNYAARRLGVESGSVVVIDCLTGDILALVSMPCFDPNSFSEGIGRLEWKMLNSDDRIPMLNKSLQGLYPPGSTLKPMAGLAFLKHGIDPEEKVSCPGGYRLGNRVFKCLGRHGPMDMRSAIMKSCNTYFYSMANRVGYDAIAPIAKQLGLGQEFPLPFQSQRYGTIPDSAWKMKKYDQEWSRSDTLNAVIGQGYVIVSPFQLAVMASRIASGRMLEPEILLKNRKAGAHLPFPDEHLQVVRDGMDLVVNGAGTAVRSRLDLPDVTMAGKTGTAQVRAIKGGQRGQSGARRYRDHGLFVCFAPVAQPRYAAAVVIEHGLGGARAAAPVAKDVLTFLYDREKAMASLEALEAGWGGGIEERMARQYAAFQAEQGVPAAERSEM
ncbi:MAG: penicillin-binding protein 2 [Sphingomonadales bacterium]|nr:penicillin-binding protein 2 [Sphingomonadales bacterium]MBK9004132.1 penicillin-binding protein 2 [Sphingomonadales bacterium]MBK9269308.1 penicillin-binding protein 2 [Sphingomonadales bacterium]MBP6435423.1 penicillin-binding protein 2 [Sphingorhabdus sp.]